MDKIRSKRDNEVLKEKYRELQKEHKELQENNYHLQKRCKYLDSKFDREMGKIEVLSNLISNTFNRVLNDSRYSKK